MLLGTQYVVKRQPPPPLTETLLITDIQSANYSVMKDNGAASVSAGVQPPFPSGVLPATLFGL
jgi:hypothetical protein